MTRVLVVIVLLLGAVNLAYYSARQVQAAPMPMPPAPIPEAPISTDGPGQRNSGSFTLRGGAYAVQASMAQACTYYLDLRPTEGGSGTDLISATQPGEYTNTVYNVDPGEYYVQAITGPDCPWSLTLTPQ